MVSESGSFFFSFFLQVNDIMLNADHLLSQPSYLPHFCSQACLGDIFFKVRILFMSDDVMNTANLTAVFLFFATFVSISSNLNIVFHKFPTLPILASAC